MEEKKELLDAYLEDFPLLVESGFVALYQKDAMHAVKLFEAAKTLKPQHVAPRLGLAYVALHTFQLDMAEGILTDVLQMEEDNELARTLLGLCHILRKQHADKGVALIEKSLEQTEDSNVQNLGQAALQWHTQQQHKR